MWGWKKINFNTNVQAQNFNQITTTKLSGLDQDLSETLIDKKQGVKAKWLPTEGWKQNSCLPRGESKRVAYRGVKAKQLPTDGWKQKCLLPRGESKIFAYQGVKAKQLPNKGWEHNCSKSYWISKKIGQLNICIHPSIYYIAFFYINWS